MSDQAQRAGKLASDYWEAIVDVACQEKVADSIQEIAAAGKVTEKSVLRRVAAARLFLKAGAKPEDVKRKGMAFTMRRFNEEKRKMRGEGKLAKRFCLDVPEDLHASLCKHRERVGRAGGCMAEMVNAWFENMDDKQLRDAAQGIGA